MKHQLVLAIASLNRAKAGYRQLEKNNAHLTGQVSALKQQCDSLFQTNERLCGQLTDSAAIDLGKITLNVEHENWMVQSKSEMIELVQVVKVQSERELEYKRQIFLLERDHEDTSLLLAKARQRSEDLTNEIEQLFEKLSRTNYSDMQAERQLLLERVVERDDRISELEALMKNKSQVIQEELDRQKFHYEILVQQYQALLKENTNLLRSATPTKSSSYGQLYQMTLTSNTRAVPPELAPSTDRAARESRRQGGR